MTGFSLIDALHIDPASSTAPFEQVRRFIAAAAATGQLPAGSRLPPVRTLAQQLHLAANTVARAYRELEEAGIVVTAGRAGTTVAATDAARERVAAAARDLARAARAAGLDQTEAGTMLRAAWEAAAEAGGMRAAMAAARSADG
ncbi:GntR family transcriptional regulator [Tersicoccus sp. Bi-70]|uniref:GntR family transcriptional regulator n=1 Tax=Tersicoccus sp. Bi-70 TaxID=1897634 RepID=UPI001E36D8BE|nr:GntR family transcriptional regulator [Tersicoccus sp. Bi-70]